MSEKYKRKRRYDRKLWIVELVTPQDVKKLEVAGG